ncbi:unnamed protein product [Lampetra planeri]
MRAPCTALLSSLCLLHLSPLFARSVAGGSRQMCHQLERLRDTFIAVRENGDERCALSKVILSFYLNVAFNHSEAERFVTPSLLSRIKNDMLDAKQSLTCDCKVLLRRAFRDMELIEMLCVDGGD